MASRRRVTPLPTMSRLLRRATLFARLAPSYPSRMLLPSGRVRLRITREKKTLTRSCVSLARMRGSSVCGRSGRKPRLTRRKLRRSRYLKIITGRCRCQDTAQTVRLHQNIGEESHQHHLSAALNVILLQGGKLLYVRVSKSL